MTYNVFSGTLNPTQLTSLHLSADAGFLGYKAAPLATYTVPVAVYTNCVWLSDGPLPRAFYVPSKASIASWCGGGGTADVNSGKVGTCLRRRSTNNAVQTDARRLVCSSGGGGGEDAAIAATSFTYITVVFCTI